MKDGDCRRVLLRSLPPTPLLQLHPRRHSRLFICALLFQEYNIHGWWVGELNGVVGIVPKDYLHPAYIL